MSDQKVTIHLTGRRPVRVDPREWPVIAEATGDSYEGRDQARHVQMEQQGQLDSYAITVRQHEDSRTIVYGTVTYGEFGNGNDDGLPTYCGEIFGERLGAEDEHDVSAEVVDKINNIASRMAIPYKLAEECIASLPPEEL